MIEFPIGENDVETVGQCNVCGSVDIDRISDVSTESGLTFYSTDVCNGCAHVYRDTRPKTS